MKTVILLISILLTCLSLSKAQVYYSSSAENILSFGNVSGLEEYLTENPDANLIEKPRFSIIPNIERNINYDFCQYFEKSW